MPCSITANPTLVCASWMVGPADTCWTSAVWNGSSCFSPDGDSGEMGDFNRLLAKTTPMSGQRVHRFGGTTSRFDGERGVLDPSLNGSLRFERSPGQCLDFPAGGTCPSQRRGRHHLATRYRRTVNVQVIPHFSWSLPPVSDHACPTRGVSPARTRLDEGACSL